MADIAEFLSGFERFQKRYFGEGESVFTQLRHGQNPRALVLACCDSRTDPAILFNAAPGEIFVTRNVANLVPPYNDRAKLPGIQADLEFAVKDLDVDRIIIMGHSGCGGIAALLEGDEAAAAKHEFIGAWVSIAAPAREQVLREHAGKPHAVQAKACGQTSVTFTLQNLMTYPWIRQRVEAGTLTLHGWYFDLHEGELLGYSPKTAKFEPLTPRSTATATNGRSA